MDIKLVQELEIVDQDPLLLAFLDLMKANGNLDKARLLKTIEGYGAAPKLQALLAKF